MSIQSSVKTTASAGANIPVELRWQHHKRVFQQWLGALLPVTVVLLSGWFVFQDAVIHSIKATPHPELIFVILGTFGIGVLLSCITLYRYTLEGGLMFKWQHTPEDLRQTLIDQLTWKTYFMPIYQIFLGHRPLTERTQQAIVEQEIQAIQERLNDRLTLPHYLSGALVGLGLVGTFIGLLGTLEDLGKLFGALVQTGNVNANPAEIFTDMVSRLQEPMRGMGTAFVASLYGLFGSLILGLQILAIGKVGHSLSNQLHALVRHAENQEPAMQSATTPDTVTYEALFAQAIQQIVRTAQETQANQSEQWTQLHQIFLEHVQKSQDESQRLRREIDSIVESNRLLSMTVRENIQAEARYRHSVPRTSYWQDAWVKVQAYLQRSNTDQTLAELTRHTLATQHTLLDMVQVLSRIDQRLSAQFSNHNSLPAPPTSSLGIPPTLEVPVKK